VLAASANMPASSKGSHKFELLCFRAVESISGIRPEVQSAIAAAVDKCVTQTDLPLPNKRVVSTNRHTHCSIDWLYL
jgi:hypothetical protein